MYRGIYLFYSIVSFMLGLPVLVTGQCFIDSISLLAILPAYVVSHLNFTEFQIPYFTYIIPENPPGLWVLELMG